MNLNLFCPFNQVLQNSYNIVSRGGGKVELKVKGSK